MCASPPHSTTWFALGAPYAFGHAGSECGRRLGTYSAVRVVFFSDANFFFLSFRFFFFCFVRSGSLEG